jgi:hypothetical protein
MSPAQLNTPTQIQEPIVFDSAIILGLDVDEEEEEEAIEANVRLAGGEEGDF